MSDASKFNDYNGAFVPVSKADLKPKGPMRTGFNIVSALIMALGLVIIVARFALGLGSDLKIGALNLGPITNLSQNFPWGLWISFDVLVGIAFAGGAYTLSVIVYMLGRHKYHPIMRSVVLGGFLAYSFYAAALILDLGRPWNALNFVINLLPGGEPIWSPGSAGMGLVIAWFALFAGFVIITEIPQFSTARIVQSKAWKLLAGAYFAVLVFAAYKIWTVAANYEIASILFMVAWHFLLYDICLLIEFSPAFAEWINCRKLWSVLSCLYMAAAIIGITLCMGHQAGVGGIFLLAPFKIQPLWYSPYIPAFFVISSFFAGLCFVLLEGSLSHRLFLNRVSVDHAASHDDVSFGLAKISVGIMLFYFALKVAELWLTGEYKLLVADTYGYWYLVEILGFVLLPALVMIKGLFEKDLTVVKFGAGLALIGIALNRFNLSLIAYNFQITEGRYVPTIMEVIVTLTVLSLEFWVYRLIVNRLPVVGEGPDWLPEH